MEQLLSTKFFIPPTRPDYVSRPRLIERLNTGLHRKLTLISAPAGFGKTTLVTEWVDSMRLDSQKENQIQNKIAWLSLDEGDNDQVRFLTYFIAALNQIEDIGSDFGEAALGMLLSPQTSPLEHIITSLINDIVAISARIIFILDDFHLIEAQSNHEVISFLLERLPPQLHLVLSTREDPQLPLAQLRAKDRLTELRAVDLSFTTSEATEFLNNAMDLDLSSEEINALESRTEGWIAGLQLVAISLQGKGNTTKLIKSFSGSHHLVLDYLIEEVLGQQTESVQTFLLRTSILDRLCGPLCDAVLLTPSSSGQETLEYLEHTNLFIVPLDNNRLWYRYHHLFADLLRQKLHQSTFSSTGDESAEVVELHKRARKWYEDNNLDIEAFQHAVAANDFEQAARLVEGESMPLHVRGALTPVLNWLESLPTELLDTRPSLWAMYGSALLLAGKLTSADEKLQIAEASLQRNRQDAEPNDQTKFILGLIASSRAALAAYVITGQPTSVEQKLQAAEDVLLDTETDDKSQGLVGLVTPTQALSTIGQHQIETVIVQSRRALEYLLPENLMFRIGPTWLLGVAYQLKGDRAAANQSYTEAISLSQSLGATLITIPATIGLGNIQEQDNQLYLAAESYRRGLELGDVQLLPIACDAYMGLARISYEWDKLDAALQYRQQSVQLARQLENTDNIVSCEIFLARLKLSQGDATGASTILYQTEQLVRQKNLTHWIPEIAVARVNTLLNQGDLAAAAHLADMHELPISQSRVYLARGDPSTALLLLEPLRQQVEAKSWQDERLRIMLLQTIALYAYGEKDKALQQLSEVLALAEPGGFIRIFIDEKPPMARMLYEALSQGIAPDYIRRLMAAFQKAAPDQSNLLNTHPSEFEWIEPLSEREIEVLQLISEGLSNQEIASRLYLSLNTVKSHTRNINGKLAVNSRMQAVVKARALGILKSN